MENRRACIFANGILENTAFIQSYITPNDILIAANSGCKHLAALGLNPHILIGDVDSLTEQQLIQLTAHGSIIFRHPTAKNETDLELAIRYALEQNISEILIFGALGGRWDMSLANIFLLAFPHLQEEPNFSANMVIIEPSQEITLITACSPLEISGEPNDIVSLLPFSYIVEGVLTDNLLYPLMHETLMFGSTRGISNVMLSDHASVQVKKGLLLCIHTFQSKDRTP